MQVLAPTVIVNGVGPSGVVTTKPAANAANTWQLNPHGRAKARMVATSTGSPATCTLRTYLRVGGSAGYVTTENLVTLNGAPNYDAAWDIQTDGDDLYVAVESLSGGTVTVALSWRY